MPLDIAELDRAAAVLRNGGIIAYPTETVFGIGCDPFNESAIRRIGELKGRGQSKTMLLAAADRAQVEAITGPLTDIAADYANRYWPGPLTMVIKPSGAVPDYLLGPSGGIAFRVTDDPVATAIARHFGGPLVSTSANISGEPPITSGAMIRARFGNMLDMVIDDGAPRAGAPSTIIDVTGSTAVVLRRGALHLPELDEGN